MMIAICAGSREEYEELEGWARRCGEQNGRRIAVRWFRDLPSYLKGAAAENFSIILLALEDILNQEVAVRARELSDKVQLIWIGRDERFGLSSYRLEVADFIIKPAAEKDIDRAMKRCLERLLPPGAPGSSDNIYGGRRKSKKEQML